MNRRIRGLAQGLLFVLPMLGIAGLAGCSQSRSLRPPNAVPAAAAGGNVRVWTDRLTLPTRSVRPDPVPHFALTDRNKYYPYPAQRDIAAEARPRAWTVLCLENEYLRVQVMPELGGRVFSVYDKLAGQEMVYRQESIKPVTVGIRGAWVAGGIEFNFPDCHSVTTHDNVHWTTRQNLDGSASVLIGDVERISRMGWTVELRLAPGCACLDDRVSLVNRTPIRQRCFYWTNAAVVGTDQVQMILPAPKVIFDTRNRPVDWPLRGTADLSWLRAHDGATGVLGVGGDEDFVAAYDHARGVGLVHYADREALPARKFWTWGIGASSDYWARRVSDDDKPYLEMQAGPRVTLSETAWMQPFETVRFEECWIPVSRIGPVARANPDAAVRLTVEPTASGASGSSATLGVLATRRLPAARVELRGRHGVLWQSRTDLAPDLPLLQTVPVPPDDIEALRLVVRDDRGRTIIEHTFGQYARQAAVPDVPAAPSRRADVSTPDAAAQRFELCWMDSRYAEALRTIEPALEKWPDDPAIRFEAGVLRLWQGRPAEAIQLLEPAAARSDATGLQARYYLAVAGLSTGDLARAASLLAPIEQLDPKDDAAGVWRRAACVLHARVLLAAGRFRDAHNLLQALLRAEPDDPYVAALAVYSLRRQGRGDLAARWVRRYLWQPDLEPMARLETQLVSGRPDPVLERMLQRDPEVAIELACDYIAIGDWGTGEIVLTGGAGLNAKSGMTWLLAGHCAEVLGRFEQAAAYRRKAEAAPIGLVLPSRVEELAAAEHALAANADSPRAAYYAGLVLMRLMRPDEAIARWRQAVALRDDNALAQHCLGTALARLNRQNDQAVAHLERAVQLAPAEGRLALDLASLYNDLGRAADARDILERALRASPASDEVAATLGEAYLALGQYRQAADLLDGRHYNSASSSNGVAEDRAVAWLGVGLQRLLEDDPAGALAALDRALEHPATLPAVPEEDASAPAPAAIHFWRAAALRALGRPEPARQAFQQAAAAAADDASGWHGYYDILNSAHAALAGSALGHPEVLARQAARLAEQPPSRGGRRRGMSDWMRAYMAFRAAWAEVLKAPSGTSVQAVQELAADPNVPRTWSQLTVLAAQAIAKYVPAAGPQ